MACSPDMKPGSTIEKVNRAINDGPRSLLVSEILISPIESHDRKPQRSMDEAPSHQHHPRTKTRPEAWGIMVGSKIKAEVS